MILREWIVVFLCVILLLSIWCIFVVSINKTYQQEAVTTTIEPMDLTVTYCNQCYTYTKLEDLDDIEFEEILQGEAL